MINILFAAPPEQFELYEAPLRQGLAQRGIQANVTMDYPPAVSYTHLTLPTILLV